jgi:hypothetical protein
MKKWLMVIGILAFLFIGGYFVLTFYAVKFIRPYVEKATAQGLTLAETKIMPTHLSVNGIQYEDPQLNQKFLVAHEVRIYPSFLSLLTKPIRIREITVLKPTFFFYRSRGGSVVGPLAMTAGQAEKEGVSGKEDRKKRETIQVRIDRIRIERGLINFEDQKVAQPPVQIKLRDLNFEMKDFRYPLVSLHSPIELSGKMNGQTREGSIRLKGWIDAKTMDLETLLTMKEIEIKALEPYYRKRVTAGIESGMMNMESRIAVAGKRIDAPGEVDLIDLRVGKGGGTVFWIPAETLASILERKGHQIKAKFHMKGNMENPEFSLQETFLTQMALSFSQALGFPVKVIGEEEVQLIERLLKKRKERKK